MRILLFSIKIFCIYSEQSREVWYWHWETVAVPANPRGALWCRTVNHCLKTPRIWSRKTSFFHLMIHFRSLKFFFLDVGGGLSVYSCCCLTDGLSFFLWMWKNVVELSRLDGMWVVLCLVLLSSALKKNTFFVNRFIPISQYWNISHSSFCFLNKDTPVIK